MIRDLLDEARGSGARQSEACAVLGVDPRTVQRWRKDGVGDDRRAGPKRPPGNKLTEAERQKVLDVVNTPEHRDLSPKQIVPRLADRGVYLASESTVYRVLRQEGQLQHRAAWRPPTGSSRPKEYVATGPNQVWSWDITYLLSPVRGVFLYLYLVMDIWSRKVVGWTVEEEESSARASAMIEEACASEGIDGRDLVVHNDRGGPMKGSNFQATLERLGVVPSFSRPRVSDDNPYSEALFRTVKYRPEYPSGPFAGKAAAVAWVARFVKWYNGDHLHSAIRFVTPEERHSGKEKEILEGRRKVYERARRRRPERWSGKIRDWSSVEIVRLNPEEGEASLAATG